MKKTLLTLFMIVGAVSYMSAQVLADFEDGTVGPFTMHVMGSGEWDNDAIHPVEETFIVVDNPDQSGINTSTKVLKFIRRGTDNGGQPWGGFWASVDPVIDVTTNKYVHYKVWKPRISPIKFKLEGGEAGTLEVESTNVQSNTEMWVDMVFDFSSVTGTYPTVALMPDFEDPLTLTGDMEMYIDDIIVNDNPNPLTSIGDNPAVEFKMSPNPCFNELNIQMQNDLRQISVFNLLGQEVLNLNDINDNQVTINTSALESGVYIISLVDINNKVSSKKLMKN